MEYQDSDPPSTSSPSSSPPSPIPNEGGSVSESTDNVSDKGSQGNDNEEVSETIKERRRFLREYLKYMRQELSIRNDLQRAFGTELLFADDLIKQSKVLEEKLETTKKIIETHTKTIHTLTALAIMEGRKRRRRQNEDEEIPPYDPALKFLENRLERKRESPLKTEMRQIDKDEVQGTKKAEKEVARENAKSRTLAS